MEIESTCPHCGFWTPAPAKFAGRKVKCAKCQAVFRLPGTPPVQAAAAAPPRDSLQISPLWLIPAIVLGAASVLIVQYAVKPIEIAGVEAGDTESKAPPAAEAETPSAAENVPEPAIEAPEPGIGWSLESLLRFWTQDSEWHVTEIKAGGQDDVFVTLQFGEHLAIFANGRPDDVSSVVVICAGPLTKVEIKELERVLKHAMHATTDQLDSWFGAHSDKLLDGNDAPPFAVGKLRLTGAWYESDEGEKALYFKVTSE
jgi:hypothetical protein